MDSAWTCAHCGDVIGVYEPAIVVDGFSARLASRLSDPDPTRVRYHEACYSPSTSQEPAEAELGRAPGS